MADTKWIWLGPASLWASGNVNLSGVLATSVFAALSYSDGGPGTDVECSLHIVFNQPDPVKLFAVTVLCETPLPNSVFGNGWSTARVRGGRFKVEKIKWDLDSAIGKPKADGPIEAKLTRVGTLGTGIAKCDIVVAGSGESVTLTATIGIDSGPTTAILPVVAIKVDPSGLEVNTPDGGPIPSGLLDLTKAGYGAFTDPLTGETHVGLQVILKDRHSFGLGHTGGTLTITPTDLRLRLHVKKDTHDSLCLDLWAKDGTLANDPVATATFALPLIEAALSNEPVVSTARRVVVVGAEDPLVALSWGCEVRCKDPSKPLLAFKVPLPGESPNKVIEEILSQLEGLVAKAADNLKSAKGAMSGMAGSLGDFGEELISSFDLAEAGDWTDLLAVIREAESLPLRDFPIPLQIDAHVANSTWTLVAIARFDLLRGRLKDNEMIVVMLDNDPTKPRVIDLEAVAIVAPAAIKKDTFVKELTDALTNWPNGLNKISRDGIFDIKAGELLLDFQRSVTDETSNPSANRALRIAFPGGLDDRLEEAALTEALQSRLVLRSRSFDPDQWPAPAKAKGVHLRLGRRGVSLSADVDPAHRPDLTGGDANAKIAPIELTLEEKRGDLRSELVIIDNQIRLGAFVGHLETPGFKDLRLDIVLGLRTGPNKKTAVFAELDLSKAKQGTIASLRTPCLSAQIDDLHVKLDWNTSTTKWDIDASATGALSFSDLDDVGGLSGLDEARSFPFRNLDLLKLHAPEGFIVPLRRAKRAQDKKPNEGPDQDSSPTADPPGHWELLEGLFKVEATDIDLDVKFEDPDLAGGRRKIPDLKSAELVVKKPRFEFDAGADACDVAVSTDELWLSWGKGKQLKMGAQGPIGFEVRIGEDLTFAGRGAWTETAQEKSFGAEGVIRCPGFPEIEAVFKIGNGRKSDGRRVPAVVIYANMEREVNLFTGAVLKRIGAGLAVNYRLAGIDRDPEPREILANLDQIRPESLDNWRFDTDNDTSIALVGTAWVTATPGPATVVSPYALLLTLIIDSDLNVVAAGEAWLFSSLAKVRLPANRSRPAMAGVLVVRPRQKTISFVAETRRNPFIEANERMATIFSKASARFSFYASEDLVDYYLEELRYDDNFLGAEVHVFAGYRIAAGRFGVLMRSWLQMTGHFPRRDLECPGVGGFSFQGDVKLAVDLGGIAGGGEMAAYGALRAELRLVASAYILIATPFVEMRRMEQTFSFSATYPVVRCRKWSCRSRWETTTWEERIVVDVPVVVIKPVRYDTGDAELDLLLEGGVAFQEGGQIGFRGTLAISVKICGFTLSIAPSWEMHGDVVDNVRKRVAAVERQVDELRSLPSRKDLVAAVDAGDEDAGWSGPEPWTLFQRKVGPKTLSLLVPSPAGGNDCWFTPSADPQFYASMPRDPFTEKPLGASDVEKLLVTPFRNSVVRILVPILSKDPTKNRLLDLVMPWDRGNMDALPEPAGVEEDTSSTKLVRLRAIQQLAQIESELLATAFDVTERNNGQVKEVLKRSVFDPGRVVVIRDPRIGSNDRRFWRPEDQVMRPDWAPPADFRPASELVALGLGPQPGQTTADPTVAEVLRYEALRDEATRVLAHEAAGLTAATRRLQARAAFLVSVLADFEQLEGPGSDSLYACRGYDAGGKEPIGIVVERDKDGDRCHVDTQLADRTVTRRGLPILVEATDQTTFTFTLTDDIILNATDLFPDGGVTENVTVESTDPVLNGPLNPPTYVKGTPTRFNGTFRSPQTKFPIIVPVSLKLKVDNRSATLFVEVHETGALARFDRRVGLVFELADDETIDFHKIRVIRSATGIANSATTDEAAAQKLSTDLNWFTSHEVVVTQAAGSHPTTNDAFTRSIVPLTPCQDFVPLPADGTPAAAGEGKGVVRVRLPIHFTDEFFTVHFASIHRFEVLRQFAWESGPVSIATPAVRVQTWTSDDGTQFVLPERFLFTDDFNVTLTDGRWAFDGYGGRLRPGEPIVRYFLRAVPFGASAGAPSDMPLIPWGKPVPHYLPSHREQLPPLSIAFFPDQQDYLEKSPPPAGRPVPHFALYAPGGGRFKPTQAIELEIWVDRQPIPLSGFYAPGDELGDNSSTLSNPIRVPSDLLPRSLPESTVGKVKIGTVKVEIDGTFYPDKPQISPKDLAGFRTRWFVRPAGDDSLDRRVVPLAMFLGKKNTLEGVKDLPASIAASDTGDTPEKPSAVSILSIDGLELVPNAELARITTSQRDANSWLTRAQMAFDIRPTVTHRYDLDAASRIRLPKEVGITWQTPAGALDGGVELLLEDGFHPGRIERITAEVFDEDLFPRTITDFRHAEVWQLHRGHGSGRGWETLDGKGEVNWQHFVWSAASNPLTSNLIRTADQVRVSLDESFSPNPRPGWLQIHQALTNRVAMVSVYLRSPLPIGQTDQDKVDTREQEEENLALLLARVHWLFLTVPSSWPDDSAGHESKLKELDQIIAAIEASDPRKEHYQDGVTDDTIFKQRLLDHELASRLAAVIRARLRVADAVLTPAPGGTIGLPEARHAEYWPCAAEWDECVSRWATDHTNNISVDQNLTGKSPRPLTERLLRWGWVTESEDKLKFVAKNGNDDAATTKDISKADFPTTDVSLHEALRIAKTVEAQQTTDHSVVGIRTNLEKLFHGSDPKATDAEKDLAKSIGDAMAGQVIEAAGLAAGLDAIKREFLPRGWRLVRRAHHQRSPEAMNVPLADFFPRAGADGAIPSAPEAAIHWFNLLERMGFAVDLTIVNDLNRAFSQRELIDRLRAYDWKAILSSVQDGPNHQVYLVVGREPDTELPSASKNDLTSQSPFKDDDDALGYGFVKLAVVPRAFLASLVKVDENASNHEARLTLSEALKKADFTKGTEAQTTLTVRLSHPKAKPVKHWYGVAKVAWDPGAGTSAQLQWISKNLPAWATVPAATDFVVHIAGPLVARNWLKLRGIDSPVAADSATAADPFAILGEVALAVHQASLALTESAPDGVNVKLIVVEPWVRRWQQVPAIGGWSHLAWPALDRMGRPLRLAARRVSRYERHVGWLRGDKIPFRSSMPDDPKFLLEIPLRRTLVQGEELSRLEVRSIPHPTRVQFVYTLPSSAGQSLLSAEAAQRTGFAEIQTRFEVVTEKPDDATSQVQLFDKRTTPFPLELKSQLARVIVAADDPEAGLLRMERLVALPRLPYHLGYQMAAEPMFAADRPIDTSQTVAEFEPMEVHRRPGWVTAWPPTVSVSVDETMATVEIFLSRCLDHMDDSEKKEARRLDDFSKGSWPTLKDPPSGNVAWRSVPDAKTTYTLGVVSPDGSVLNPVVRLEFKALGRSRDWTAEQVLSSPPAALTVTRVVTVPVADESWFSLRFDINISTLAAASSPVTELLKELGNYRLIAERDGTRSPEVPAIPPAAALIAPP